MRSSLAGALLSLAAGALAAPPDFDEGVAVGPVLEQARREAGAGQVWISVAREELGALGGASALGAPAAEASGVSVFRLDERELPGLAERVHEALQRCGGFFAHRTREAALADLAPARGRVAAGPYTIDQRAVVEPLAAAVREQGLRETIERLSSFHNRYYDSDSGVEAAQWLAGRWRELAASLPGAAVRTISHSGWRQPSVVLTIPGSEKPEELVVLGGHLDSIAGMLLRGRARAPGADDNASGIAVLTEAARVLSQAGFRPRRTVQFIGYAAEEVGLRGSLDIAQQYREAGTRVVGVVQFDMTNFPGSGSGIYVLSDHVSPALSAHLRALVDAYAGVPSGSTSCGYACSDHASWTRSGFPASAAFESTFRQMNKHIHTDRDTLSQSGGDARHSVPFAKLAVAFAVETAKPAP